MSEDNESVDNSPESEPVGSSDYTSLNQSVPTSDDQFARAEDLVKRMEAANKTTEAHIRELQALGVQRTLAGKSGARPVKEEESAADYARKALNGDLND